MQPTNFTRAGILALFLSFILIVSWEIHLRNGDMTISYDDNEALWADKRAMVYEPIDQATVFIGSSRNKFDMDIPTWESITGDHAIQLANVGSSPKPVLEDLSSDENFKGKLIIDVTEGVFFSPFNIYDPSTRKKIAYYKNETPTQKFSFQVDRLLESQFYFLDQDNYSINAMLDNAHPFGYREGVFPGLFFPKEFEQNRFTRQSFMTPRFVADTNLQKQVTAIWAGFASRHPEPPISGAALDSMIYGIKFMIDKIKARGGKVIFVRTPSSGPAWMGEMQGFPRDKYWDRLLTLTGCEGIHFKDYPASADLICTEWSHLSPANAIIWTKTFIQAIHDDKGWSFKNLPGKP